MSLYGLLTEIAIAIVAGLHIIFFALESLLWTKPAGRKVFGTTAEEAETTKVLALNQGFYNLFLAAGLIWSLVAEECSFQIKIFFLSCVIVAGIVGGITAKRSILIVQALPALLAMLLVFFTQR
jgi:putative membrane protein